MTARRDPVLTGPGLTWLPDALSAALDADPARALVMASERLSARFAFVPAGAPWAADAASCLSESGIVPVWACSGPFGYAASLLGWEVAQLELARHPDAAGDILATGADRVRDEVRAAARAAAPHIVIADDLVVPGAWLVTPSVARRAIALAGAIIDSVEGAPDSRIFHTDGDPTMLIGALAASGFVAVHTAITGAGLADVVDRASPLAVLGGAPSVPAIGATSGDRLLHALESGRLVLADDGGITDEESLERVRRAFSRLQGPSTPSV